MSEADKLFKKLGYKIEKDEYRTTIYKENVTGAQIYICVFYNANEPKFRLKLYEQYCPVELLKAINLKYKELGWIEE